MHRPLARFRGAPRVAPRSTEVGFRSWTGRSALSCATDSALPHLVTAGTRRTRVSEMRLPAAGTRASRALPAAAPFERRSQRASRPRGSVEHRAGRP
jgi:hypothetical protein